MQAPRSPHEWERCAHPRSLCQKRTEGGYRRNDAPPGARGGAAVQKGASMLLERELVQSVGFRNVREGGRVTGFQVRLRMPSYRGMGASLIDGVAVRVGVLVDVGHDVPLWTFAGRSYTLQELWDSGGVRWPLEEAAIVTVPHPGGLPEGTHEVSIELRLRKIGRAHV